MDQDELQQKLASYSRRRSRLASEIERYKGMEEVARRNLEAIEAKCREKNVDPNRIDEVIKKMEDALAVSLEQLDGMLGETESQLEAFESTIREEREER